MKMCVKKPRFHHKIENDKVDTPRDWGIYNYFKGEGLPPKERKIGKMPITRKFLKALGIEDDKVDQIVEEHTATIERVNADVEKYKADADKLKNVQQELDKLKSGEDYKAKYDTLRAQIEGEKIQHAKEKAARAYLKSKGITDDASLELAMLAASKQITELEIDGEKIKDANSLDGLLSGALAKLVTSSETKGTDTNNPAGIGGDPADLGSLSMADYIAARHKK